MTQEPAEKNTVNLNTNLTANLTGVPETMLWTLHNRANEAMRDDGIIKDPKCVEIYQALDYDYEKSFGKPDGSHAVRSVVFDNKIREFLAAHPDGVIVNLGEGLETQRYRIATDNTLWISLDLPEGIAMRERFIQPDEYHRHLAMNAFDTTWFKEIPIDKPVFITAQGLFMFFPEEQVKQLLQLVAKHLPQAWLMFDHIPRWMSAKTLKRLNITPHYIAPKMPWGINKDEITPTLSDWLGKKINAEEIDFVFPRGKYRYMMAIGNCLPVMRKKMYGVSFVKLSGQ